MTPIFGYYVRLYGLFSDGIDRIQEKFDKMQYWKLPFTYVTVQQNQTQIIFTLKLTCLNLVNPCDLK